MHNHLRQNMCPAHQNRSLANGPSHPRLDPEEIQMADVSGVTRTPSLYRQPLSRVLQGRAGAAARPSHAQPCLLASPSLTRMTGLALPTSLRG